MSRGESVPCPFASKLRKRTIANHVLVAGSKWHRGSLVNARKSSWKGSFTFCGPWSVLPCRSYTRHAELTISTTKPLPSHRPWSGGSNFAPKLVISLSRRPTPLKLATTPPPSSLPLCCAPAVGASDRADAPTCATGACRWPLSSRLLLLEEDACTGEASDASTTARLPAKTTPRQTLRLIWTHPLTDRRRKLREYRSNPEPRAFTEL